jgi:hypothetical protein
VRALRLALRLALLLSLATCGAAVMHAQTPAAAQGALPEPVRWTVTPDLYEVRSGGRITVRLIGTIRDGWHLYGLDETTGGPIPTTITVGPSPAFTFAGVIGASTPNAVFDPNFDLKVELYSGRAEFRLPVKVVTTAGAQTLLVSIRYQSCSDTLCLAPRTVQVPVAVTVR